MTRPLAPPSSTALSLALDRACGERIAGVPHGLAALGDPRSCPAAFLPALAWTVGLEEWDPDWPEAVQRDAVESAIAVARERGTWAAMRRLLDGIGAAWTRAEGPPDGLPAMTGRITIHNGDSLEGARIASILPALQRAKRLAFELELVIQSGVMLDIAPAAAAVPLAAGRVEFV